jgi:hypothetical protein
MRPRKNARKRYAFFALMMILGGAALSSCKIPRPPPVPGPVQPPPPPGTRV